MLNRYESRAKVQAVRVEGELFEVCSFLETHNIAPGSHPMWKIPGGYDPNKMPNAIMLQDAAGDWVEADVGDYIMHTVVGPRVIPGEIFDMFFMRGY